MISVCVCVHVGGQVEDDRVRFQEVYAALSQLVYRNEKHVCVAEEHRKRCCNRDWGVQVGQEPYSETWPDHSRQVQYTETRPENKQAIKYSRFLFSNTEYTKRVSNQFYKNGANTAEVRSGTKIRDTYRTRQWPKLYTAKPFAKAPSAIDFKT